MLIQKKSSILWIAICTAGSHLVRYSGCLLDVSRFRGTRDINMLSNRIEVKIPTPLSLYSSAGLIIIMIYIGHKRGQCSWAQHQRRQCTAGACNDAKRIQARLSRSFVQSRAKGQPEPLVLPGRMIATVNRSDYVFGFCYAISAADNGVQLCF